MRASPHALFGDGGFHTVFSCAGVNRADPGHYSLDGGSRCRADADEFGWALYIRANVPQPKLEINPCFR